MSPRPLLLVPGALALLAGLDAGLVLLGAGAPVASARLAEHHGVLMIIGFLGTVISLERAVSLSRGWGYLAPLLTGAGAVLVTSPAPLRIGQVAMLAGVAGLLAVYVPLWRRRHESAVAVQMLGAALAVAAMALWHGGVGMAAQVPLLAGFIILTIAGERMELARIAFADSPVPSLLSTLLALTAVSTLLWPAGYIAFGLSIVALVGCLLRTDVARQLARSTGLPRFSAVCLLAGYGWLLVAGLIWALASQPWTGAAYEAAVHATFLGFAFSMVLAHAPVILPAVLRVRLPYRPVMYAPAALLHVSLLVRLVAGAHGAEPAHQVGGVGTVVAVLAFVLVALGVVLTGRRSVA